MLARVSRPISGIVDNNESLWGSVWNGHTIDDPQILESVAGRLLVVICTTSVNDVMSQLARFESPQLSAAITSHLANQLPVRRLQECNPEIVFTSGEVRKVESSGHHAGGLFTVDFHGTREPKRHLEGSCHGLAFADGRYLVTSDADGLVLLDESLNLVKSVDVPGNPGLHGATFIPEAQQFAVVATAWDSILLLDLGLAVKQEIKLSRRPGVHAAHHCNDLVSLGGNLFVSMFSESGFWRQGVYDGAVLAVDPSGSAPPYAVIRNLHMPHSPTVLDGELFVCDSLRGNLVGPLGKVVGEFSGFVRGLDFSGDYWLLGHSRNRNSGLVVGEAPTVSIDNGFVLFDPKSSLFTFRHLPGEISEIHAVMIRP